ncbi:hypothetical protein [Comamonas serinivorans]|uniref:hypothetical protein n=1 Tax=Comamonas serinivorans TaxID=1082851 RepID=UPI001F2A67EC|nr:hypothetical protein [Comamonas serinivorans]
MEKTRYIKAEAAAQKLLPRWPTYDPYTQATFVDFIWNKGEAASRAAPCGERPMPAI